MGSDCNLLGARAPHEQLPRLARRGSACKCSPRRAPPSPHSCLDLLDEGATCLIGADHRPLGLTALELDSEQACLDLMARVRKTRHARATRMNEASDGHAGSSRSHCAIILTLRQLERSSARVLTTRLDVIDMAGAERPRSVQSTLLAMWDHEKGDGH